MTPEEAQKALDVALKQVADLAAAQQSWAEMQSSSRSFRANEDAQIYKHLRDAFSGFVEGQALESWDDQGHSKTIELGNSILEVTVVHRAIGIEDVYGVDLFYNFNSEKYIAFQHKKRDSKGYLRLSGAEEIQRIKIKALCQGCRDLWPPTFGYVQPGCSALYVVKDASGSQTHVVSACLLHEYQRAFVTPKPKPTPQFPVIPNIENIDDQFLQCLVGRRIEWDDDIGLLGAMIDTSLQQPNLVVDAHQTIRS